MVFQTGPDGGGSRSGASVSGGDIGGGARHGRVGQESSGYDSTDEEDDDPSNFQRSRNSNFPGKSNHSKFVADQQMHPSRARSVGPQPKFSHKQNNVSRCVFFCCVIFNIFTMLLKIYSINHHYPS